MSDTNLLEKLKTIVEPYVQNKEAFSTISEETDFINDLKINSANLIDVALDVEDEFDIMIENDDMDKMLTVKSSLEVIEQKLAEK
ncbi:acyl carrier protein [Spongiivirga citrea]|uniref:Acyl carrier protein n=1 Tax=Spongiivirga citrea TaxID=1481457 RepID=A0A6M0CNV3_9FLAO|nr:acyl carrier protein [Spongiivirga citrea]NER15620.1 acyl carrier protein [Spongiivirga citrea]